MTAYALSATRVFTGSEMLPEQALVIAAGQIQSLMPVRQLPAGLPCQHYPGLLAPGLIDLQVNGGGGVLFNDQPNLAGLEQLARSHRRFGTTGLLPTLISDQPDIIEQGIAAVEQAIQAGMPGILGIHIEGPHLNPERRGIHRADRLRPLASADIERLTRLKQGKTLLTLAPEILAAGQIRQLRDRGAIIAAGHSAASYADIQSALAEGLTGFTHLFNAMSPLTSREPGVVGAALDDANSWCSIIVDGQHVHPASLRIALAAKAPGQILLVSDAMPAVGTQAQEFKLQGTRILVDQNRCCDADGTLAGALLDMASALRNSLQLLGVSLEEALRMASLYPAKALGIDAHYGRLAPGYRADIVLLDEQLQVTQTWIAGQPSEAPADKHCCRN